MRFYISLPAPLVDRLRTQAQEAHRPPRHHAEWLLMQALREQPELPAILVALLQVSAEADAGNCG